MEPVACPPIKRKRLAMLLQRLEPLPSPKADLEQYPTPPEVAAYLLYKAYGKRDIYERKVADLGCGNGILAVGAARIGAEKVIALDSDPECIEVTRRNGSSLNVALDLRVGGVHDFNEKVDTVVMNPPFGGQRKHADLPFIQTALRCARVAYSFHNARTRRFVSKTVEEFGGSSEVLGSYTFPLPHTHPFHRQEVVDLEVDLYRMERLDGR